GSVSDDASQESAPVVSQARPPKAMPANRDAEPRSRVIAVLREEFGVVSPEAIVTKHDLRYLVKVIQTTRVKRTRGDLKNPGAFLRHCLKNPDQFMEEREQSSDSLPDDCYHQRKTPWQIHQTVRNVMEH